MDAPALTVAPLNSRAYDLVVNQKDLRADLNAKITSLEGWRQTAFKVAMAGLIMIGVGVCLTALFYASPIIPFALVILAPLFYFIWVAFEATGGGGAAAMNKYPDHNTRSGQEAGDIWSGILKISIVAGIDLGKFIYTKEVGIIVGLTNAAIAAVAAPIIAVGALCSFYVNRKITREKQLLEHFNQFLDGKANLSPQDQTLLERRLKSLS